MTTKTKHYQTPYNKRLEKRKQEWGPSLTVPGQSQQLSDIMRKYSVGMSPTGRKTIYDDDTENTLGINPRKLDYVDIERMKDENIIKINRLNAERQRIFNEERDRQNEQDIINFEKKIREKIKMEQETSKQP